MQKLGCIPCMYTATLKKSYTLYSGNLGSCSDINTEKYKIGTPFLLCEFKINMFIYYDCSYNEVNNKLTITETKKTKRTNCCV